MSHARGCSRAGHEVAGALVVVLRVAGSSRTAVLFHPVHRATRPEKQLHVARVRIAEAPILNVDPQVRDGLL